MNNFFTRTLGILILALFCHTGFAQTTASYSFSAFTATYSSISGTGTATTGLNGDDLSQNNIPIGFNFNYCGATYNQLSACTNGFVKLSNTGGSPFTNILGNITSAGWLLAFWDDLHGSGHQAYYQTTGSAPNRVWTFEWNNFHHFFTSGNGNLQIKLYETSNVIDFCYGTNTYGSENGTIGITNTSADYTVLNNSSATPTHITGGTFFDNLSFPAANQVYRWSPCPVLVTATASAAVCPGGTVTLTGTTTGTSYSWSGPGSYTSTSLSPTLTGVTAGMAGTYVLSATNGTCTMTASTVVTVNPTPPVPVITPTTTATSMCNGATLTLTSSAAGTWSTTTNLFSDAAATIPYTGASTATVYLHPTTVTTPTAFTYTVTVTNGFGCTSSATKTITVNPAVASITGPLSVCAGYSTTLSSSSGGGTWSSLATGVATVTPTTGVVTGITPGTASILYTVAGCSTVAVVTVTPTPGAITGILIACLGSTTTLSNSLPGGTWSSSNTAIGTVGSSTGVVTGIALGTTTITYDMGSGCYSTATVTVNPYPSAITGAPSVCVGACTVLSSTPSGGLWTSVPPGIATVGVLTGNVCGVTLGTATISYRVAGCAVTMVMTVVSAAAPIVGPTSVCVGSQITLTNSTPGGSWASSTPSVGTIGSATGIVTGISPGTTTITYALSAGCTSTMVVTVTPAPLAITGTLSVCEGLTTTLSHPVPSGTWTSSNPAIATVGFGTGLVTGVSATPAPGTTVITYTLPSTCFTTSVFTVHPIPAAITGSMSICQGSTSLLSSATPGGTWSSGTPATGTINATTGLFTGLAAGSSIITYTLSTGCIRTGVMSVNAIPAAITGASTVCIGQCILQSDATPFGGWSSSTPAVGTISGAGVFCGVSAGTSTVTYALGSGCYVTRTVTVTAGPAPITGSLGMCVGFTTTLSSTTPGGTWSSGSPVIATVLGPGGFIGGNAPGTATISYTVAGCSATADVTVNALPGAITGPNSVCVGQTVTQLNATAGGTWSSGNTAVGTIDAATGVAGGISAGTTTITYSLGSGCITTRTLSVNTLPTPITGTLGICEGACTPLGSTPIGGTWSSGSTAVATVSSGGSLCGVSAGTAGITYSLGTGCTRTAIASVNPQPAVITGGTTVCIGQSTTLSSTTAGGTWSSSNGNVTIIPATGVATGVFAGTSTITYTLASGCYRTVVVLVNANPTAISGTPVQVCEGSTTTLTGTPSGSGTWSSSTPAVGTIGLGSGILGGVTAGTTTITYTIVGTGCYITTPATVNALPGAVTGTPTTCIGQTTTLSNATPGGTWSSSNTAIGTIGTSSGILGGIAAGTTTISYTLSTGCRRTITATVFALPGVITGNPTVCEASTTTLSCLPTGGTWTSSATAIATVAPTTGVVTGVAPGTATITYTVGTGCTRTITVTVNALPTPISGSLTTCVGQTTTLASTPVGGTWLSNPATIATVDAAGTVSGISGGTGTATAVITYTAPNTCQAMATVTVYTLPSNIAGSLQVCQGSTTALTTASPGGTWVSSNTSVGTIDVTTGVLYGNATGTTTITYTVGTGCYKTAVATVNPNPLPITGTQQVCEAGGTTTLTNFTPLGTWSSSNTAIATVHGTTGVVTGVSGTATAIITYTLPTGCRSTTTVTVYALPTVLLGPSVVCKDETITLTSTPPGGTWSSGSGNATVNPVSGVVTGVNPGTATISYTQGIGCTRTKDITINALPSTIGGTPSVCMGQTTTLTNTSPGGTWISTDPSVATISSGGVVTPVTPGTTTISYTFTATGCASTVVATVNGLPGPITGSDAFCNLSSSLYNSSPAGGTWTSADATILTIDPSSGLATGVSVNTTTITYTLPTGCIATKGVYLILAPYPIGGPPDICLTQCATLDNIIGGGVWSSSDATVLTVAPVTPTTATACGINVGVATITYQLSTTGCYSTKTIPVNPIPSGTTGPTRVCEGSTAILTNTTPGGTWSSSNTAIGTIGSTTGIVGGISQGTVILTYALGTGCNAQFVLTVDPLPTPITGNPQVCEGLTTTLASTPVGIWSGPSGAPASIDAGTGVVTGMYAGTTMITYTLPTGCLRELEVTVNPLPSVIVGVQDICVGNSTTLTNATAGGGWISSDITVATIDATGTVFGVAPGTVVISYMLPTSCIATHPMTVNTNPAPITGNVTICAGFATNLTSSPAGGTWSSGATTPPIPSVGGVHPITGVVTGWYAGTIPVTYTLGSGCLVVETVTVVDVPPVIAGVTQVCVGGNTTLTNTVSGGVWSSSNPSRATIGSASGIVTGVSAGIVVMSYTVGTPGTCFNVLTMTVNPTPAAITTVAPGIMEVCEGSQLPLSSTSTGGTWASSSPANATVGISSGIVTGILAGTAGITYTLPTGCQAQVEVTVNPTPPGIVGNPHVCMGSSNTFTNGMAGGVWSISNPSVANISATGVVTSVTLGTATITYQMPITGCMATRQITVQPLPVVYNVTGGGSYCAGGAGVHIKLSNSQIGVSYVLYHGSSATGYLSGTGFELDFGLLTAGGVYTVQATNVHSGCKKDMAGSATVVVIPLITPVVTIQASPNDSVCPGETVVLSPVTTTGGTAPTYLWKVNGTVVSMANSYSFIPANGDVASVTMTSNMSCLATPTAVGTKTMVVMPSAIPVAAVTASPNDTVCQYNPVTLTANPIYGGDNPTYTWYVNGALVGYGPTHLFTPVAGDEVYAEMVSDYRCRTATTVRSEEIAIGVDSLLIPTVSIYPDPGFFIEIGKPVTLHTAVTNGGPSPKYQWKVNGKAIAGATLADYTAIFNDYDSISCVVTSSGVCANIGTHDWVFITVTPLGNGAQSGMWSDIKLIPNPNRGLFTIKGTLGNLSNEEVNIEVTDMLGQVVYRGVTESRQGRVESKVGLNGNLANGMYILTLRTTHEQKTFHFVMEQ